MARFAHGCAALAVLACFALPASATAGTNIMTIAGGGTQAIIDGQVPITQFATDVEVDNPTALSYTDYGPPFMTLHALRVGDTPASDPCVLDTTWSGNEGTATDVGHYTISGGQAGECSPPASIYGPTLSSVMRFAHPLSIAPYKHNNAQGVLLASTDLGRVEFLFSGDTSGFTKAGSTPPATCGGQTPPAAPDGVTEASAQFCKVVAVGSSPNGPSTANDPPYAIGERGREAGAADRGHVYYVAAGTVHHISGEYHVGGMTLANNGDILVADGIASIYRVLNPGSTPVVRTIAGFFRPSDDRYFTGFQDGDGTLNVPRFNHPVAIAQGYDGQIYVADSLNCRVRRMADSTGDPGDPMLGYAVMTTVAGQGCNAASPPYGDGGPATSAQLANPSGLAMSPYGLYVADTGHDRIRLIDRTSITSAPTITTDTTPEFEFASLDTPANLKCTIDDGSELTCPTPYTPDALSDGQHTLKVWENNPPKDPTPAVAKFTVDTVAPVDLALNAPASGATDPAAQPDFTWTEAHDATTAVAGYELWIDGVKSTDVPTTACAGGTCTAKPATPLDEKDHKWQVRAIDSAGNVAKTEERDVTIGGPPAASMRINPNPALVGRTVTFDGSASADPSGITKYEWDLDGDNKFERDSGATATTTRTFDAPATVAVTLRVTDGAGKTGTTTTQLKITQPGSATDLLGISVNSGAQYTNDPNVKLLVKAPVTATSLLVSNDGGFLAPSTFPVAQTVDWKLDSSGPERLPKTVYARFMLGPIISETYTDDIILDEIPPVVQQAALVPAPTAAPSAATAAKARAYVVKVKAKDSNSGVSKVQITANKKKPGPLLTYKKKVKIKSAKKPKFLRARDRAGNFSPWKKLR